MGGSLDPTIERLEEQIKYYDAESCSNKRWYLGLKGVELVAAALIPPSAVLSPDPWVTALLGVVVVLMEGLTQLNQFHANWIGYRSTCESLKHEKFLYIGKAGPYKDSADPHTLLAERTEELVSREHSKWVDTRSKEPAKK